MDFMQALIGVRYKEGGMSPEEGFDCYNLVRFVIREGLGIVLPENTIGWRHYGEVIEGRPDRINRYDLLFFCPLIPDVVTHVGVANDHKDFTHADHRFMAVVCEPISKYADMIKAVGRVTIKT